LLKPLADWFDARAGYRALIQRALEEPIPGGARWKYVWGAALASTLLIQLVTGLLMMLSYSPSSSTAWGSVFFINERMTGGWFIRGIHHFGSQAMVVLLALHLLQVLWAGAYRAPRELNWWFGIALMVLTLGFCLTGYLLPWDQKGYWATKVATNIMGGAPVLGPYLQRVVVGGTDYGNQTLTRFYGLHTGILPILLFVCLAVHVALFRRHGVTTPRNATGMGHFWPEQLFRDTIAALAVFSILVYLVVREGGAKLDAPADPTYANYPARPEWYFLALFQMLKLFPGKLEVVGTIIIPGAIMTGLLVLPLLDKILPTRLAHVLACSFVFALIGGAGYLTSAALREDADDQQFQAARQQADQARDRALQLAKAPGVGIPPEGASYLLLRDPLTHGRAILEARCLGCHRYRGRGQSTQDDSGTETISPQTASDLEDFGTRAWVRGLLENPESATYFGKVPQHKGMKRWKKSSRLSAKELDAVADFVTLFATVPPDMTPAEWVEDPKVAHHPGFEPFVKECGRCHAVPELTEGGTEDAPNLFAWGSPQWIARMIKNPGAPDLFGFLEQSGRMPAFDGQLTDNDLTALVHFLKGDYLPPSAPAEVPTRFQRTHRGSLLGLSIIVR
jgi:quinol-cytochrome oxidoreductase complex cytochrome b subunit/mono/diheme cytochrome c family protein